MNNPSFLISFDFRLFYMIIVYFACAKVQKIRDAACNHIKDLCTQFTFLVNLKSLTISSSTISTKSSTFARHANVKRK